MNFDSKKIAQETVDIIKHGGYKEYVFNKDISKAILYTPLELESMSVSIPTDVPNAKITLYNEDTCQCARKFLCDGYTCILNFASAKHVGGGFLNGAMAQEEAICRNSSLYASISSNDAKGYYEYNNRTDEELYSDYIIFSPCVEVFRDGRGRLLDYPYPITISAITSPAVNVHRAKHYSEADISKCMTQRAEYILKVAVCNQVKNIVLGAWGCGVFGNSPTDVSNMFKYLLFEKGYAKCFNNVSFAIYGLNLENYTAFKNTFDSMLGKMP
ncbi:MAG: TIGR02452 family protein [Ruminococcus sp.]|nr:TIGR02452 family protein [Ruminococcus sp.]